MGFGPSVVSRIRAGWIKVYPFTTLVQATHIYFKQFLCSIIYMLYFSTPNRVLQCYTNLFWFKQNLHKNSKIMFGLYFREYSEVLKYKFRNSGLRIWVPEKGIATSGGSGLLVLLVIKLCRKYGEMSQSSGTPRTTCQWWKELRAEIFLLLWAPLFNPHHYRYQEEVSLRMSLIHCTFGRRFQSLLCSKNSFGINKFILIRVGDFWFI